MKESEILDDLIRDENDEWRELEIFVDTNQEYYLPRWKKITEGKIASFNWAAFLVGMLWLLYRKMYIEAGILLVIILTEGFLSEMFLLPYLDFQTQSAYNTGVNIAYGLILGFLGNYIYYNSACRKIEKLKKDMYSGVDFENELKRRGGVTTIPILIVVGIVVIILVILLMSEMSF